MTSFQAIAVSKNTNLAVVAPGIAEALFATALGLLAAIPAVIFYNKFNSEAARQGARLEGFADEFAAILSRQTAGIVGRTLDVNPPGKPASIRVCLDAVFPAIPYCNDLAGGPYLDGNPAVVQVYRPKAK